MAQDVLSVPLRPYQRELLELTARRLRILRVDVMRQALEQLAAEVEREDEGEAR